MAFYSALDAEEAEKTERFPQIFKCVAIKKLYLFIKKKKGHGDAIYFTILIKF